MEQTCTVRQLTEMYTQRIRQADDLSLMIKHELHKLLPMLVTAEVHHYKRYPPVDDDMPTTEITLKLREITEEEIKTIETITKEYLIQKDKEGTLLDVELFITEGD